MQHLLNDILRALTVRVLARYKPKIVAIAGSVGKTSTRRAVAAVLRHEFPVRESHKNFNNEIGVPLTVLGETETGGKNPFAWAGILLRGAWLAYGPECDYPEILVLEMGTDHPGDLAYLTAMARPDVAVVTAVSEEHSEFLGGLDAIAEEEGTVVAALPKEGTAVLNADDPRVAAMRSRTKAKVITYGLGAEADVRASNIGTESAMGTYFTRFDLAMGGPPLTVNLPGAIGMGNVYAAMASAAAAKACGIDPAFVPYGLGEYQPPPGRLRAIPGVRGTTLIDDTYNSSPAAVELALRTLHDLTAPEGSRRIALLGDMLELGPVTEEAHRNAGRRAAELRVDILIGVGPFGAFMCEEAVKAGMPESAVFHMHDPVLAGRFIQDRIRQGDRILIKGSQGIRMEKAVKELMAEPERTAELLVRQTSDWT